MSIPISPRGHFTNRAIKKPLAALATLTALRGISAGSHDSEKENRSGADAELTKLSPLTVESQKTKELGSPKFTEPLRDIPQTIAVIPREVYLQQGASSLSDVLRNTAGITFAAGEGGGAASTAGDSFYMRGFDSTNNLFVDGVRDVGAYSRDVFNLEQVEVAKGPAGADIGRGGASGYVNVSTKVPRGENFTAVSLAYGFDEATSGSRRRASIDVNQVIAPLPARGTAIRVNALRQDNDAVGRDYAHSESWAIAPSLALGLGTPNRLTVSYQHTQQDNIPDYGLPSALLRGYLSTVPVPAVDRSTFYGFSADSDRVTSDSATARLEHDFSSGSKLTNQTRYSANQREAVVTVPGQNGAAYNPTTGLLTRSRQANKRDSAILSNQTNLTAEFATGPLVHHFSGGLELSRETLSSPAFSSVTLTPVAIEKPDFHANPNVTPFRSGAYTDVETKTAALYAFDTVHLGQRWQANASVRAERYHTHFLNVAATAAPSTIDARHSLVSWKTGFVFKPAGAGSLYAAYAISLAPPGTDFTLSSAAGNQNNPDTDPQETANVELGVKWDFFHGRLSTTAAVFKTTNDKTVYTDPVLGPIPAGRQTVQGVELGISRRFTDNWLVLGSVSFLDSEIAFGTTSGGNLAGSELPLIPKYSGSLFTSYRLASGITIGGGGQYSDEVARRDNNTPAVPRRSPAYWLFNAFVSFPVTKNLTLRANVNNLLDREFVQSANNNGARFSPGAPRAFLLTADYQF
jgi:catecholate siderophore receptor